jgi:hypothetical protein
MLKIKIAKVFFSQKCNVGAGYDAWRRLRDFIVVGGIACGRVGR